MPASIIEVTDTVAGSERTFRFKSMPVEEAGSWAARMKSRVTFWEALGKRVEEMESVPVEDRDADAFLRASDSQAKMLSEIVKTAMRIADYVVEPARAVLDELMDRDVEGVVRVFNEFLKKLFPSEQEAKN